MIRTSFFLSLLLLFTYVPDLGAAGFSCRLYDELRGSQDKITALAFCADGSCLASGDADGTILLWDPGKGGEPVRRISGHGKEVTALLVSPRQGVLFSGGKDKYVRMWNLADGKLKKEHKVGEKVRSLALSPDERTLIIGGKKGEVFLWDTKTGRIIKTIRGAHDSAVHFVAATGEDTFRSVGEDRKTKFWEVSRSRPLSTMVDEYDYEVETAACNPSMDICAMGATVVRMQKFHKGIREYYNIYLRDGMSWGHAGILKGHDLPIQALAMAPEGDYLASGGDGKYVHVWDLETGQIRADMKCEAEVSSLAFCPNGEWLAAGLENGLVIIFRTKGIQGPREIPEVIMAAEPDLTPGESYAVIIGISKFQDSNISPLKYTVPDARAFYDFITSSRGGNFDKSKVKLLLDREATKVNIEDALKSFLPKNAGKDDMVVLFFAGHGIPETDLTGRSDDGMEKYLVPTDADLDRVAATCVPMSIFSEVFSSIRSKRVIFFIDSCFSGGGAGKGDVPDVLKRTFSSRKMGLRGVTLTPGFLKQLTEGPQGYGKVLITASQANEQALELPELGHGLFTYYLLEALSGDADNGDGYVTLKETYDYLEDRVAMRSRKEGGKQTPMMAGSITGKIVISRVPKQ